MSMLSDALGAARLVAKSPAWSLLRAQHAAPAVAILGEHLGGDVRRLAAPVLFERIEEDLAELRDHGFDLPRPAQAYCAAWRDDGYLIRRAAEDTREETFELSEGALTAIRFVAQLAEPRQSVTESRLSTILERVRLLALATDPDVTSRLAALEAERDRIDAEIARVATGDFEVLAEDRALERAADILSMAEAIPGDFARVRAEMEQINQSLRERLIDQVESRGSVLDDVFRGVDHLADSDAGRSFTGFSSLILNAERSTEFEEDVAHLLDRDFASGLSISQAKVLRRMLPSLQDSSAEIHDVMSTFSRSLRRFVQTQEFQEDRRINQLLRETLKDALRVSAHIQPFRRTSLTLHLTTVAMDSVAALRLHNPADAETVLDVVTHEAEPVDLELLRLAARASEIDLKELMNNVNDVVGRRGAATIGEVLEEHPATQGVASVVGLLVLAEKYGVALDGGETISWTSRTEVPRSGTVPLYLFKEELT